MTQPNELADLCESAEGPSRELDRQIAVARGWCLHPVGRQRDDSAQSDTGYTCLDCGADSWGNTGPSGQKRSAALPAYSASIDAALTLVPSGWQWTVTDYQGAAPAIAVLGNKMIIRNAATPALAICAAALRANGGEHGR